MPSSIHQHKPLNKLLQGHVAVEDAAPSIRVDTEKQRNQVTCDSAHLLSTARVSVEQSFEILRLLNAKRLAQMHLRGRAEVFQAAQDPGINTALMDAVWKGIDVVVKILMILAASKAARAVSYAMRVRQDVSMYRTPRFR